MNTALEIAQRRALALAEIVSAKESMGEGLTAENRKLSRRAAEKFTGVEAQWLGAVMDVFDGLIAKAKNQAITDADLIEAVEESANRMPDLFGKMDWKTLGAALAEVEGTAMVNGAAQRIREYVHRQG